MEVNRFYHITDMVRVPGNDCRGCHSCCQGMGDSVVLTPYDMHSLSVHLQLSTDELFEEWLRWSMADGLLQPVMSMAGKEERCRGLNEEGRCSIHAFRPAICRLFPLGRQYYEDHIAYFVLEGACPQASKAKVKISKWIERPEWKGHEAFLLEWHRFKKRALAVCEKHTDETFQKQLLLYIMQLFYRKPYTEGNFYPEFADRLRQAEELFDSL